MSSDQEHISIFIAYSREDEKLQQRFLKFLAPLERSGLIKVWYDGKIPIGSEWDNEIHTALAQSDMIIALISSSSLASTYFFDVEMNKAFARAGKEECEIIPIILSECLWKETSFGNIQAIPEYGKPIATYERPEVPFFQIAQVLKEKAEAIRAKRKQAADIEVLEKQFEQAMRVLSIEKDYQKVFGILQAIQSDSCYRFALPRFTQLVSDQLAYCQEQLDKQTKASSYQKYYSQALSAKRKGDLGDAIRCIKQALSYKDTAEARKLKNQWEQERRDARINEGKEWIQRPMLLYALASIVMLFVIMQIYPRFIEWIYTEKSLKPVSQDTMASVAPKVMTPKPDAILLTKIKPKMVFVEGGTFMMGCTSEQKDCRDNEKPAHKVELASFYMGATEVSFAEYDAYYNATGKKKPDDVGWEHGKRSAINVSWYDVVEYCNWLSELEGLEVCYSIDKGIKDPNNKNDSDDVKWTVVCDFGMNGYRLPTEAEWEYAARGGNESTGYIYAGVSIEDSLHIYGNFCDSKCEYSWQVISQNDGYMYTSPVGIYRPNELGLYDMSGNVWEWCWDWYDSDMYKGRQQIYFSPRGSIYGSHRVLRGGSWSDESVYLRVSNRNYYWPLNRNNYVGFRLARTP